ncbi:MAG: amidohydrolase family protein [Acidimicrobiia bacterium]|nr:amidohydrolase family protein [Acidimicrobiia bacterium]
MLDCVIRGGMVVDGTGAPGRVADVGVRDGRIVSIGRSDEAARQVIDADGLAVAPGFIDVHTHYDAQVLWDPHLTPSSLHGITTAIGGNCGFTIAPMVAGEADYVMRMLARVEGMPTESLEAGLDFGWSSFGSWLDRLEGSGLGVNAGFLVGHSTVRRLVMGSASVGEAATDEQIEAMKALLGQSLAEGGLGFSSTKAAAHNDHHGDPVPSRAASDAEMVALAGVCRDHPGTTLELIPSIDPMWAPEVYELMTAMVLAADRPLNWNLFNVRPGEDAYLENRLGSADHARERGAAVVGLMLPDVMQMRLNFATGVLFDTLPDWAEIMHLDPAAKAEALARPEVRQRLLDGAAQASHRTWVRWAETTVVDVSSPSPHLQALVGRNVGELAAERGQHPFDVMCDIALEDDLMTGFGPPVVGDDDESWKKRAEMLGDPRVLAGGSDAGAHLDMMMTWGCTSALVGDTVRDRGLLSLEQAVNLVTDRPARHYGLRGRGRLAEGWYADIVVFDPARLTKAPVTTAWDMPGGGWRLTGGAEGIEHVLVNGVETQRAGVLTEARPGTVIRSGRDTDTVTAAGP